MFRQAGRHLPEYTEYKQQKGKNFLQLLNDPEDVTEITLQPIRRYNVDAAILFSDILVILQALGIEVTMPGGSGITVPNPITSIHDYNMRIPKDSINIKDKLSHVFEAIRLIKMKLNNEIPLIGFSAAPWTLMYYILGGTSKKNQNIPSLWLSEHPLESKELLDLLTTIVIEYISEQIHTGVDIIQIFEAMGGNINENDFYIWALPCMERILKEIKQRHPTIPIMIFARGANYALESLQNIGYDVITLDTNINRQNIHNRLTNSAFEYMKKNELSMNNNNNFNKIDISNVKTAVIQGNFDINYLRNNHFQDYKTDLINTDTCISGTDINTPESVKDEVKRMFDELGTDKLIANIGEGLTGLEDPVLVHAFVEAVHSLSSRTTA